MATPGILHRSSSKVDAIRRGDLKISKPIPIDDDASQVDPNQSHDTPAPHTARPVSEAPTHLDDQPPRPEDTVELTSSKSPPGARTFDHMSPNTSESTTTTTPLKKKRKSGLKNVFRKMFGRKEREELPNVDEEPARRGHSYHHSDPGLLRQVSPPRETASKTPSGPRISDLPVEELQPLHPLGQHLPFPMNVNAPQTTSPREYLSFSHQHPDLGRRRATLPSLPVSTSQRHSLEEPRGRLSSWEERNDEDDPSSPGIGIALSGPPPSTLLEKRRSRSVGALRELASARQSLEKSRSEEIKYWRESYASASVYSSHTRPQTATKTDETVRNGLGHGLTYQEAEPAQEMSATLVQPGDMTPLDAESPAVEPPTASFDFGPLSTEAPEAVASIEPFEPPMTDLPESRASMENRVKHLEDNVHTIETSLRRLSTHNSHQTIILEHAPRALRSRTRSTSRSASASTVSVHQAPAPTSNRSASAPFAYTSPPSPPLLPVDARLPADIRAVYEALAHERAARKALETRVATLTNGIADLRTLVNKLVTLNHDTNAYPTPSPDSIAPRSHGQDEDATPRAALYESNTMANGNGNGNGIKAAAPYYDDGITPDVWATPKEGSTNGSGFFNGYRE